VAGEGVGGAAAVGPDQPRLVMGGGGELGERQVDDLYVVGGGVGTGVAWPQDAGQRLAGPVAASR
jgi:hypothetical protein